MVVAHRAPRRSFPRGVTANLSDSARAARNIRANSPYAGTGPDTSSEVSKRARQQKVSCWTIEQLALVVEVAESRHISATQLQNIVLRDFDPASVTSSVTALLQSPSDSQQELYVAILRALRSLTPRLKNTPRNVSMLAAEVSRETSFLDVQTEDVLKATEDLGQTSRGMVNLSADGNVQVLGDLDELSRRVAALTGENVPSRRRGSFSSETDGASSAE